VTSGLFSSPEKRNFVFCLLIFVLTLVVYNRVNGHPFVNYDDDRYVTDNPHVRAGLNGETIAWAFSSTEQANWHPLTWISHALDCQLFRLNPAGHHFTSVVLHAINAVLLFLIAVYATGFALPSLVLALLFALHPVNVESVAWIAERKNVLSTLFFFLTLGSYGWYIRKPDWKRYLATLSFFACGLMSKPMLVTLPFVLLLLDYWPLQRTITTVKRLLEKIPFFALSAASAIITMYAQQGGGAMRSSVQFPFNVRLENAVNAYAAYLWKTIWPVRLAPLYPHPGDSLPGWQIAVSALVLVVITAMVIRFRPRKYLLVGWLWFLGTLVPVIGLLQVGDQAMADRYAYIPLIGMFLMVVWGFADFSPSTKLSTVASALAITLLCAATYRQTGYWSTSYDLWSHTLAVTQNNFIAHDNLGGALLQLNRPDEAFAQFQAASQINRRDPMSHTNMGAYLQEHGRSTEAIEQFQAAISLTSDPGLLASNYANLGTAYRESGNSNQARENYERSLQLNPGQFNAYLGRARLLESEAKYQEAAADFQRSAEIQPTVDAYLGLGRVLQAAGKAQESKYALEKAIQMAPDSPEVRQAIEKAGR
jgi:Tfp pilus assembly protein PilF